MVLPRLIGTAWLVYWLQRVVLQRAWNVLRAAVSACP
jgi:hypothetical protein